MDPYKIAHIVDQSIRRSNAVGVTSLSKWIKRIVPVSQRRGTSSVVAQILSRYYSDCAVGEGLYDVSCIKSKPPLSPDEARLVFVMARS